jgi:hypothetical protein
VWTWRPDTEWYWPRPSPQVLGTTQRGVQEVRMVLKRPLMVVKNSTERPESIELVRPARSTRARDQ